MMDNASALGMSLPDDYDPSLLAHPRDGELLRALAEFPRVVAAAAELREPHRVARYLEDTTSVFNKWYDTKECRMLPQGDEPVAACQRGPADAGRRRAHRAGQRARPARRHRAGADVAASAHLPPVGLGARRRGPAGSPLAARAGRPQRPRAAPVVDDRPQGRRRAPRRRPRGPRPGRRRQHPGVPPRRGGLPGPRPGLPRRLRGQRRLGRLLRREGLPLHDGRPLGGRGGAGAGRLHRR